MARRKTKTPIRWYTGTCVGQLGKIAANTVLWRLDDDSLAVRFHGTDIIICHADGTYTYNNGGYETPTTKERMNRFGPLNVYQYKHEWWYDGHCPFENGMRVDQHGNRVEVMLRSAS